MQPAVMEEQQMEILGQPKQFANGGIVNALMATPVGQAALRQYATGGEVGEDVEAEQVLEHTPTGATIEDILAGRATFFGPAKYRHAEVISDISDTLGVAPIKKKKREVPYQPDDPAEEFDPSSGIGWDRASGPELFGHIPGGDKKADKGWGPQSITGPPSSHPFDPLKALAFVTSPVAYAEWEKNQEKEATEKGKQHAEKYTQTAAQWKEPTPYQTIDYQTNKVVGKAPNLSLPGDFGKAPAIDVKAGSSPSPGLDLSVLSPEKEALADAEALINTSGKNSFVNYLDHPDYSPPGGWNKDTPTTLIPNIVTDPTVQEITWGVNPATKEDGERFGLPPGHGYDKVPSGPISAVQKSTADLINYGTKPTPGKPGPFGTPQQVDKLLGGLAAPAPNKSFSKQGQDLWSKQFGTPSQPPTPGVGSQTLHGGTPTTQNTIDPLTFDIFGGGLSALGSIIEQQKQADITRSQAELARNIADSITPPPTRTYKQLMDAQALRDSNFQNYGTLTGSDFTAAIEDFQQSVADAGIGGPGDDDSPGQEEAGEDALGGIT